MANCAGAGPGTQGVRAAARPVAFVKASKPPRSPAARACGSLPKFSAATANEIMAGRVTLAPWPAVYPAGYVFGRSGGGPRSSFYSLRFGPGRQVHGHDDHMGLTYYARGRNLIVDAGHTGYENTPYRAYLRSPEASSTLVMPGVRFDAAAATSLVIDRLGRYAQFYELHDTAFGGDPRYRSVYVSQRPDLALVFDRASGAAEYQQLWHLDPALRVTTPAGAAAIATAPRAKLELLRIPLPGQFIPAGSTQVVRGQVDPYQGWVSHQMLQRTPADVVEMTEYGSSAAMLTLLVPTAISGPPDGPYTLKIHVGHATARLTITAAGRIWNVGGPQ